MKDFAWIMVVFAVVFAVFVATSPPEPTTEQLADYKTSAQEYLDGVEAYLAKAEKGEDLLVVIPKACTLLRTVHDIPERIVDGCRYAVRAVDDGHPELAIYHMKGALSDAREYVDGMPTEAGS